MNQQHIPEEVLVIFQAAQVGRADIVQHAISSIKQSQASNTDAVQSSAIKTLLSSQRPNDGASPLHVACMQGHADVTRCLLSMGVSVTCVGSSGTVKGKLAYEVATTNCQEPFRTYLFEEIAKGNAQRVREILSGGVSVTCLDGSERQETTLHWAASFGHIDVARILIEYGANVNAKNVHGRTPLYDAANAGHTEMVELLSQAGGDSAHREPPLNVTVQADKGSSALGNGLVNDSVPKSKHASTTWYRASDPPLSLRSSLSVLNMRNEDDDQNDQLLKLWPTPKVIRYLHADDPPVGEGVQTSRGILQGAVFRVGQDVSICVPDRTVDVFPLLTWSNIVEALSSFGLHAQARRSCTGGHIRLAINPIVCCGFHRFHMRIAHGHIALTASDTPGLMYGLHTLTQVLRLHARIGRKYPHATPSHEPPQPMFVILPALEITDWPDVPQRAIMWSFQKPFRPTHAYMRALVPLLSRLRLSHLILELDTVKPQRDIPTQTAEDQPRDSGKTTPRYYLPLEAPVSPNKGEGISKSSSLFEQLDPEEHLLCTNLFSLDEVCRRYHVELLPALTVKRWEDGWPMEILKNFSSPSVMLVIESTQDLTASQGARKALLLRLQELLLSGRSSIIIASGDGVNDGDIVTCAAMEVGMDVVNYGRDIFRCVSPPLHALSFLCTDTFISTSLRVVNDALEAGRSLSVLPLHSQQCWWYPTLLHKTACFVYAGLCWNATGSLCALKAEHVTNSLIPSPTQLQSAEQSYREDETSSIFTSRSFDTFNPRLHITTQWDDGDIPRSARSLLSHVRPLITLLLFDLSVEPKNELTKVALDMVTGGYAPVSSHADPTIETLLWSVNIQVSNSTPIGALANRRALADMLKEYRSVLADTRWKALLASRIAMNGGDSHSFDDIPIMHKDGVPIPPLLLREVHELAGCCALLSVTAKAMLIGRNACDLHCQSPTPVSNPVTYPSGLSTGQVLSALSLGARSDTANSLLETLEWLWHSWARRFDARAVALVDTELLLGLLDTAAQVRSGSSSGSVPRALYANVSAPPLSLLLLIAKDLTHFDEADIVDRIIGKGAT